jgi:hypothetical protein
LGETGQRRKTGKGLDIEGQGGVKEKADGEVRKREMGEEEEEEKMELEDCGHLAVAERDRATPRRRRDPPIRSCRRRRRRGGGGGGREREREKFMDNDSLVDG